MPSRASIVIPAYNEERRIRGLLGTVSDPSIRGFYDVYVVCNGCIDRTRQVAEEYEGLVVVEIDDAGKYHALNEGDRLAGDVYPRLYCDADVQISPSSITALVEALTTEEVKVAGPTIRYGVEKSTRAVKMFFRALEGPGITGWQREHLVGRGLYGASRAARRRFTSFPPLTADDLFFDSQFVSTEKVTLPDAIATVWVPVSLRQLVRAEVRVAEGNQQYRVAESDEGGVADHAVMRPDRFERGLEDRIKEIRGWFRDGDVLPVLFHLGVLTVVRMILAVKKLRRRQINWR